MIQVYVKQRALFEHPMNLSVKHEVAPFEFSMVPDWVPESRLFKMLAADGKAIIVNAPSVVAEVEKAEEKRLSAEKIEKAIDVTKEEEAPSKDLEIEKYAGMKTRELYDLCMERGIECEEKKQKAYYIDLLSK